MVGEMRDIEQRLFDAGEVGLFFFLRLGFFFDQFLAREQFLAEGFEDLLRGGGGILAAGVALHHLTFEVGIGCDEGFPFLVEFLVFVGGT